FFSSRRRHTRFKCDWSSDVCSSDLDFFHEAGYLVGIVLQVAVHRDNHFAAREIKPRLERRRLAEISPQPHDVHAAVVLVDVGKRSEERRVGKEWRWRG